MGSGCSCSNVEKLVPSATHVFSSNNATTMNEYNPGSMAATDVVDTDNNVLPLRTINLESRALLWLDRNVHKSASNIENKNQLRSLIDYIETFDDMTVCEEYIRQSTNDHIFFIVSGSWGKDIVPRVHQLSQVSAIYVYCREKSKNELWAKKHSKVIGIFVDFLSLRKAIADALTTDLHIEEAMPINIFSRTDKENTHNSLNGQFLWFHIFIDMLLRMDMDDRARVEMINTLKLYYKGNSVELNLIDEFERTYSANNAIWWYTRQGCFYQILNKALRVHNFDALFKLRFFIKDIYKQLLEEYDRSQSDEPYLLRVYRGQVMFMEEILQIRQNVGQLISINTFFSTSRKSNVARSFLQLVKSNNELHRVLFIISANKRLAIAKPFAEIQELSYFREEEEVLFMIASIMRIENVTFDETDRIWTVQLTLCSDTDDEMQQIAKCMIDVFGDKPGLYDVGAALWHMGRYEMAKKFFLELLNNVRDGEELWGICYEGLGIVAYSMEQYDNAIACFTKALDVLLNSESKWQNHVADIHNVLGAIYSRKQNHHEAIIWFEKALEMCLKMCTVDDPSADVADIRINIASQHAENGDYDLAIAQYTDALKILERKRPKFHPNTAACHEVMGSVYYLKLMYDKAIEHHKKALDINLKCLPPEHDHIAANYCRLAEACGIFGQIDECWMYLQKAAHTIKSNSRNENTVKLIPLCCGTIAQKFIDDKQFKVACAFCKFATEFVDHSDQAPEQNYTLCLFALGIIYNETGEQELALKYYEKALKIRLQQLTHGSLAQNDKVIGRIYFNQGNVYRDLNDFETAIEHYEKSCAHFLAAGFDQTSDEITRPTSAIKHMRAKMAV